MGKQPNAVRAEFSAATKRLLGQRAAYRCSNPGCGALTIGPGAKGADVEITGTASHIYAAAQGGPRGTGGLSAELRSNPRNGIWLCARCGRLVDTNDGGAYPASLLRGWRDLQETRVRMEHGGVARPFGWVHSIEIIDDVWLAERTTVQFSRCNMFIGPNDVGKTHFMSLLSGLSAPSHIMRRAKVPNSPVHAAINWYDPNPRRAEFKADGDHLQVSEDGVDVPFVVQPYQVITFPDHAWRISGRLSDVAHQLDLDLWAARRLLQNLPEIVDGAVKQVSIEGDLINAVVSSRGPGRLFRGERDRPLNSFIAIELLVALAETYARAKPTLLLLDGLLDAFPGPVFEQFSALLSSPARTFQTVATSVHPSALKNPEWTVTHFVFDPEVPRRNRGARPARLVQDDNPLHTYDQWRSVAKSEWRTYSEGEEIRRRWKVSHAGDTQPGTGIRPAGEARAPHGTR